MSMKIYPFYFFCLAELKRERTKQFSKNFINVSFQFVLISISKIEMPFEGIYVCIYMGEMKGTFELTVKKLISPYAYTNSFVNTIVQFSFIPLFLFPFI